MNNVYNIIKELRQTSSTNEKVQILKNNSDNDKLKKVFEYALDPFKQFYIRKIPQYDSEKHEKLDEESAFNLMFGLLDKLSRRQHTGNVAIARLKTTLEVLPIEYSEILKNIIGKDMRCGVAESTVNKVWCGLIKEFPVMLCSAYNQKLVDAIKYPAYAQLKADGMRVIIIIDNENITFYTRKGKEILLDNELKNEFLKISKGAHQSLMFDGEMLCYENDTLMNRQSGNGVLNKAVKGTISQEEQNSIRVKLWDVIPLNVFNGEDVCVDDYKTRFDLLKLIVKESDRINIIETSVVNNIEEVNELFREYIKNGYEGIILKSFDGVWEDKRSKKCVKFKGVYDADLRIVEVIEGEGKNKGKLGSIKCRTEDGGLVVNVGSGFTDEQRILFYSNEMLDKIVAVEYNEKIIDKHGNMSLFLPVFVSIRDDKTQANTIEELT